MAAGGAVGGSAGSGRGRRKPLSGGAAGGRAGKAGSHRKGSTVGSGGQGKRKLAGRGPTPPAEERVGHPKARAKARADRAAARPSGAAIPARSGRGKGDVDEVIVGRNPVVEVLRARVPVRSLVVALGLDYDDRVDEALRLAARLDVPIREAPRHELDRVTSGAVHQGLALVVPPYRYADPHDLLDRAVEAGPGGLLVALDGVTDPHNLGAIVRSAAAFGAQGVVIPERRAAGMTATAWKTSAGAAARIPVARATNLVRTLKSFAAGGLVVVGLDSDADITLDDMEAALDPLVLVIGAEGKGLSRLVAEACDLRVGIPMSDVVESLNASVAAAVVLAEVARRRRNRR